MKYKQIHLVLFFILIQSACAVGQDSLPSCKVELQFIAWKYKGDCKNGLADGKGDASGIHHYTGLFKKGLPNGKGSYYYNDTTFYTGNFQNGIKEGKGEMHFVRSQLTDSVIEGYWSGDEYRGTKYITYSFSSNQIFDNSEIQFSEGSGNTITFNISTTSGSPAGASTSINKRSGNFFPAQSLIARPCA